MRSKSKIPACTGADDDLTPADDSLAPMPLAEGTQVALILIAGLLTCIALWIAGIAGAYGAAANSEQALGIASGALNSAFILGLGTVALFCAYRFALRASPAP